MADLRVKFCGIESPNPFWLASGPPTNTKGQVMRAFDAGWGGAVWKTIGELIIDRPTEVNILELAEVKKRYPKNLVIASLMVESKREKWHEMVRRVEDAG